MGGPWRSREFDPAAWHPPTPHVADPEARPDNAMRIVVAYLVSVSVLSAALLTVVAKFGYAW